MKLPPLPPILHAGAKLVAAAAVAATLTVMPTLRPYQQDVVNEVNVSWLNGNANVLAVAATGSGKTVIFSSIVAAERGAVCAVAHRHELVSQMSMALARCGVRHRIIGSPALARECRANHLEEFGVNYVDPNSHVAVASVDTLIGMDASDPWFASVRLWVMDEAHHVLKHNKWGTAVNMFPNARGLGVTAETERADGYGLGRQNDGVFDAMVVAPTMRDLINMGFLTEYRVIVPPSDLDLRTVTVGSTGDYSQKKLAKATKASHIMGDVVTHYMRYASGKLGITFAVDIEAASDIAEAFRKAGVPAEVVSSKTDAARRRDILRQFKRREILQLVNVDLFGEGFDLPAIECVSMARATKSFNLYKQQFGRALRLMEGKDRAIIIDHVGNVQEHNLPDKRRTFSLGRPTPKAQRAPDEDLIPQRTCLGCSQPYDRIRVACPYCKTVPEPLGRSAPEFVDGDLHELSPDVLAEMRGDADAVMSAHVNIPPHLKNTPAEGAIKKRHFERAQAQGMLHETMNLWAGWRTHLGETPRELQKLFFLTYGVDVLSAKSLGASEAYELRDRVQSKLNLHNIVAST